MKGKLTKKKTETILSQYYQGLVDRFPTPPFKRELIGDQLPAGVPIEKDKKRITGLKNLAYALLIVLVIAPGLFALDRPSALGKQLSQVFKTAMLDQRITAGIAQFHNFFLEHYFGRRGK